MSIARYKNHFLSPSFDSGGGGNRTHLKCIASALRQPWYMRPHKKTPAYHRGWISLHFWCYDGPIPLTLNQFPVG